MKQFTAPSHDNVANGLVMVLAGVYCTLALIALMLVTPLLEGSGVVPVTALAPAAWALALVASVLSLLGRVLCLTVPQEARAAAHLWPVVGLDLVATSVRILDQCVSLPATFQWLATLLGLGAGLFFLFFLRQLALYADLATQGKRATNLVKTGVAMVVLFLGCLIVSALRIHQPVRGGNQIDLLAFAVHAIMAGIGVAVVIWLLSYARLLHGVWRGIKSLAPGSSASRSVLSFLATGVIVLTGVGIVWWRVPTPTQGEERASWAKQQQAVQGPWDGIARDSEAGLTRATVPEGTKEKRDNVKLVAQLIAEAGKGYTTIAENHWSTSYRGDHASTIPVNIMVLQDLVVFFVSIKEHKDLDLNQEVLQRILEWNGTMDYVKFVSTKDRWLMIRLDVPVKLLDGELFKALEKQIATAADKTYPEIQKHFSNHGTARKAAANQ